MPKKIRISTSVPEGKVVKINHNGVDNGYLKYDNNVSFSFQFLREKDDKFKYSGKDSSYFLKLVNRLKDICTLSRMNLITSRSKSLRCHPLDWNEKKITEECFSIPKEEEFTQDRHQIQISSNAYGRVHGFFILDVFYVVWLDPEHELYS